MAGRAEITRRDRKPAPFRNLPPHVRLFADHLAAALAARILREIRAGDWDTIGCEPEEGRGEPKDDDGK
jgi:hypothetical protein